MFYRSLFFLIFIYFLFIFKALHREAGAAAQQLGVFTVPSSSGTHLNPSTWEAEAGGSL